jgi:hypothetical protein
MEPYWDMAQNYSHEFDCKNHHALGEPPGHSCFSSLLALAWTVVNLVASHLALVLIVLLSSDMYGRASGVD